MTFAKNYINREINRHMSTLVVVGYDDPCKAEEVRLNLWKLQNEYHLDLEDAVVAVKDEKGKIKLHQAVNLSAAGALSGGFWGTLTKGNIFEASSLSASDDWRARAVASSIR